MKTKLIIVESPSKCKKIEKYAGNEYKCLATCGHIYSLSSLKNVDIADDYKPTYTLIKSKMKHINAIKDFIKTIDKQDIYLATDPDREGEAIAWHLCDYFKLNTNTTKRLIFNEITETAIKTSLNTPTTINMKMVESQQARQVIDLIVGFKICPVLWKYLGIGDKRSPLSAGRCQTPCLNLIKELHDKECEKQLKHKYTLTLSFNNKIHRNFPTSFNNFHFSCNLPCSLNGIQQPGVYETLLLYLGNNCDYILSRTKPKKSILKAPLPLSTSLLQQKANQYLRMSPITTMKTAQKLYEKGYITYMRTDSHRYSKEFITKVLNVIKNGSTNTLIKSSYKNYLVSNPFYLQTNTSTSSSQDGHESIRPTNIEFNIEDAKGITQQEVKLYNFIFFHTLQTFMKDAVVSYYDLLIIPRESPNNPSYNTELQTNIERTQINIENIKLKYTLKKDDYKGWKIIDTKYKTIVNGDEQQMKNEEKSSNNENNDEYETFLNLLNDTNQKIEIENKNVKIIQCIPYISGEPSYYSEANLVRELEKKGIGRPSTFASLVDKIQSRHYVQKMNIDPKQIKGVLYTFNNIGNKNTIETITKTLETSQQKNRLVIQELGKNVNSFCYSFFEELFNYDFTASLESDLDLIVRGQIRYVDVCKKCDIIVEQCIASIDKHNHTHTTNPITNSTPSLSKENNSEEIRMNFKTKKERVIGTYDNEELIIKSGLYGYYAQYGNNKVSLRNMNMIEIDDFVFEKVVSFIEKQKSTKEVNLLREIDDKISIWKGKKGKSDYIMIKANHNKKSKYIKKPTFISLKKFEGDYLVCDVERIKEFISIQSSK
jgi:DNA topoisomerase-1